MRAAWLLALLALPLCACDGGKAIPGGTSESDAAALSDAAIMLNADAVSPQAVGIEMESVRNDEDA